MVLEKREGGGVSRNGLGPLLEGLVRVAHADKGHSVVRREGRQPLEVVECLTVLFLEKEGLATGLVSIGVRREQNEAVVELKKVLKR